mgnify:CR=1 FL=1
MMKRTMVAVGMLALGGCVSASDVGNESGFRYGPQPDEAEGLRFDLTTTDELGQRMVYDANGNVVTNFSRGDLLYLRTGADGFIEAAGDPNGVLLNGTYGSVFIDADTSVEEMTTSVENGEVVGITLRGVGIAPSETIRASVERVTEIVSGVRAASEAERDVMIQQLETQAEAGDFISSIALQILRGGI